MGAAPESRRLKLATGLEYHFLEWDSGSDHTVVLVHGFLDLGWGWVPVARAGLDEGLHLVAPDMRGHGHSDRIGEGGYYHFMDYLADLDSLISQVGRKRVSLVGHSMGGSIVTYYAGTFPERVERLAVLEGLGPPDQGDAVPSRVASWISAWRRQRGSAPRSYVDLATAARRLQKLDPLLGDDLALELAEHGTRDDGDGGRCFLHDPLHLTQGPYPFRVEVAKSFWQRVACPTLFVTGTESVFRHAEDEMKQRQACFKEGRHAYLDGAAHMMMRHQPAALAQLLGDFLRV